MLFLREFWKEVDCASPDLTTSCLHCPLAVVVAASGEGLFQNLCTPYDTVASSPTSAILGRWWSSILEACPAQCSCILRRMVSMLVVSAAIRTSVLVIESLQCSGWWGWRGGSSGGNARGGADGDGRWPRSQHLTGEWSAQQLWRRWSLRLSSCCYSRHVCVVSQRRCLPLPVDYLLLCRPWRRRRSRYPTQLNWWTAFSSVCPMKMLGGWYSSWGAGWWRTQVFFKLTSSPKVWAASANLYVIHCMVDSVWATRASLSANNNSLNSCSMVFVWTCKCLRLYKLLSARKRICTPSSSLRSSVACWSTMLKNTVNIEEQERSPVSPNLQLGRAARDRYCLWLGQTYLHEA